MQQLPWWVPIAAALTGAGVGAVLGFVLSQTKDWLSRRRRRKAHWAALRAEIKYCGSQASTYLGDQVAAPLYRLPTIAYGHSLGALLSDGAVDEAEVEALITFYSEVETLNRGLDQAHDARGDGPTLENELRRNRVKAKRLKPPETGANYYSVALDVVDRHLG